jgi:hypothetical protein
MADESEIPRYFIQQESPADPHPAILKLQKVAGCTTGYYWDRKSGDWRLKDDILRQYWNGFDPDVVKVSEAEAFARIRGHLK